MAKVKYDVRGVESGGRNFKAPPPGVYTAKVHEVIERKSSAGNPMLEVIYEISKGDYKGSRVWDYIVLAEEFGWKLRGFLEATGQVKPGNKRSEAGTLDTDKIAGTTVLIRTKNEMYEGEPKAKLSSVMAPDGDEPEEEPEPEEELDEKEELDEPEEDDEEEDDEEEPEEDDEDEEDYSEWSVSDLKAELSERGLKATGPKSALVKRLTEDDEEDPFS